MNIFRKNINQDLTLELDSYKTQITELETQFKDQDIKIQDLIDTVQTLTDTLKEKEAVIEQTQEVLEQTQEVLEQTQEVVEEVIEQTVTVEKLASQDALNILSTMGVTEPVETIDGPEEVDLMAQMKNLKGKELTEFYNKNKSNLFKTIKQA